MCTVLVWLWPMVIHVYNTCVTVRITRRRFLWWWRRSRLQHWLVSWRWRFGSWWWDIVVGWWWWQRLYGWFGRQQRSWGCRWLGFRTSGCWWLQRGSWWRIHRGWSFGRGRCWSSSSRWRLRLGYCSVASWWAGRWTSALVRVNWWRCSRVLWWWWGVTSI